MADDVTAYPLSWPRSKKRTDSWRRIRGPFTTAKDRGWTSATDDGPAKYKGAQPITIAAAIGRLKHELELLGARNVVISTNLELRLDGLPKSNQRRLQDDPGVAVYFRLDKDPVALACDKFIDAAQNLAACAAHVNASRAIERHGVGSMREIFRGFMALPSEALAAEPTWQEVLGDHRTLAAANRSYYDKMRAAHPDMGGTEEAAARLNRAIAKAREELK